MSKRPRYSEKKLSNADMKILNGLASHGPRNLSKLAGKLKMPVATLRYRINYLRSAFNLDFQGTTFHTNVGLRKTIVFARAKPGYEDLVRDCLRANDYWIYISQALDSPRCLAMYSIPAGREREFEEFINGVKRFDKTSSVESYWSTCFQTINATNKWFDAKTEEWTFPWDSWLQEITIQQSELPTTLKDPAKYEQMADWIDIIILKELEKNSAIKKKAISNMLGMSLQRLKYHFENHVIKGMMYEGPQITAEHFKGLFADTCYFRFVFPSDENLAKFASSLLDKPFARSAGRVFAGNDLFVQMYLPRKQFRNFLDTLGKLVRSGFLETYDYLIQDLAKTQREVLPYQLFKKRQWEYDHKKFMDRLGAAMKQSQHITQENLPSSLV